MKTKTHFAFRVDIWDHAGDTFDPYDRVAPHCFVNINA
jgi:hypothetical protein